MTCQTLRCYARRDVISAAQAQQVGAMVATENVGDLALFVGAKSWRAIVVDVDESES